MLRDPKQFNLLKTCPLAALNCLFFNTLNMFMESHNDFKTDFAVARYNF